jgi:nitrogen regulatory protein P-II 1
MKKIEAIIREEKLEAVRKALEKDSYFSITVSEASGQGLLGGLALQWCVGECHVDFLPKVKQEIVIMYEDIPGFLNTITTTAHTVDIGEDVIFSVSRRCYSYQNR